MGQYCAGENCEGAVIEMIFDHVGALLLLLVIATWPYFTIARSMPRYRKLYGAHKGARWGAWLVAVLFFGIGLMTLLYPKPGAELPYFGVAMAWCWGMSTLLTIYGPVSVIKT